MKERKKDIPDNLRPDQTVTTGPWKISGLLLLLKPLSLKCEHSWVGISYKRVHPNVSEAWWKCLTKCPIKYEELDRARRYFAKLYCHALCQLYLLNTCSLSHTHLPITKWVNWKITEAKRFSFLKVPHQEYLGKRWSSLHEDPAPLRPGEMAAPPRSSPTEMGTKSLLPRFKWPTNPQNVPPQVYT